MLKNLRNGQLNDVDEGDVTTFPTSKMDGDDATKNEMDSVSNSVATSTPQKVKSINYMLIIFYNCILTCIPTKNSNAGSYRFKQTHSHLFL